MLCNKLNEEMDISISVILLNQPFYLLWAKKFENTKFSLRNKIPVMDEYNKVFRLGFTKKWGKVTPVLLIVIYFKNDTINNRLVYL